MGFFHNHPFYVFPYQFFSRFVEGLGAQIWQGVWGSSFIILDPYYYHIWDKEFEKLEQILDTPKTHPISTCFGVYLIYSYQKF